MTKNDTWSEYLDEGENIIWQGRPVPGFEFELIAIPFVVFGLAFAGIGLYLLVNFGALIFSSLLFGGFVLLFSFAFIFLGLSLMAALTVMPLYRQKYTWYSLTNRRAFVATALPWTRKRLVSYPITIDSQIDLEDGPLQTVFFATETHVSQRGEKHSVRVGFDRITSGREVYKLLNNIRAEDLERRNA